MRRPIRSACSRARPLCIWVQPLDFPFPGQQLGMLGGKTSFCFHPQCQTLSPTAATTAQHGSEHPASCGLDGSCFSHGFGFGGDFGFTCPWVHGLLPALQVTHWLLCAQTSCSQAPTHSAHSWHCRLCRRTVCSPTPVTVERKGGNKQLAWISAKRLMCCSSQSPCCSEAGTVSLWQSHCHPKGLSSAALCFLYLCMGVTVAVGKLTVSRSDPEPS